MAVKMHRIEGAWLLATLAWAIGTAGALADEADLSVQLSATPSQPGVGRTLTLQITITNRGPATATDVVVSNPVPATVTFVSATQSAGTSFLSNGCLYCSLAALPGGSNASLTVALRPDFSGNLTHSVSVQAAEPDPNPADNTTSLTQVVRPPYLYLTATKDGVKEGDSGATNAVFNVRLDAASGETISVDYAALGTNRDTATPGLDFTPVSGTLVLPPGVTNDSIVVPVLGDTLDEFNETFSLRVFNPTNVLIAQQSFATATILDDDPLPVVSVSDATLDEGGSDTTPAVFQVTLSAPGGRTTSVRCTTFDGTATAGSDYLATNFVLSFAPGVTSQPVAVFVKGNTVYEGDETFFLRLSSPSYLTLGNTNGTGLILDDDAVPGRLDHFGWSAVTSPQVAGVGFPVTVTALDAFSNVVGSFAGPATLTARDAAGGAGLLVSPTVLSSLVAGVWQGVVIVHETNAAAVLRADDGLEHVGDSMPFAVVPMPRLVLQIQAEATEGQGAITGLVSVVTEVPRSDDLTVSVAVSNPDQASAPATVTIPAGSSNASFSLTVVDDALLDGSQALTITISASNCIPASAGLVIHDNETNALSFLLPASVLEDASVISGGIRSAQAPARDVTVNLGSSNTNKVQVPATVVLRAGTTLVTFRAEIVDNGAIDGPQAVTLTGTVSNWSSAVGLLTVVDDEPTNLVLALPAVVVEGQGTLPAAGTVRIGGTLGGPLTVTLGSSDPSEITVPASVVIPAGATAITFAVTVPDDSLRDGTQLASITAQAPGLGSTTNTIQILDNDPASMIIGPISSPQTSGVPFQVRIQLFDVNGLPAVGFQNTAVLRAWGAGGYLPVSPDVTGVFQGGEWTGAIAITGTGQQVQLMVQVAADFNDIGQPFLLKAPPVQVLNVPLVRDLVYSPQLGQAYLSIQGSHAVSAGIALLDPESGASGYWKSIWYAYPDRLALSADGQTLYVTFPWDGYFGAFPVPGGFDRLCSFGSDWWISQSLPWQADDLEALAGPGDRMVAARSLYHDFGGFGGRVAGYRGVGVYGQGVPQPDAFMQGAFTMFGLLFDPPTPMRLTASADGQTVFCTWPGLYAELAATSNGVTPVRVLGDYPVPAFASGYGGDLVFDRGLLYRDNGEIVDPNRIELVGRLPAGGLVRPDSGINRVFLLASNGPSGTLRMSAYDQATLVPLGGTNLSPATGTPTRPTRCGTNTLAFATSAEQVVLLHGLLLPTEAETDLATSLQCVTPTITRSNPTAFTLTVTNQGANSAGDLVVSARLPAALGPMTVTSADGTCSTSNGTLVCTVPFLAAGESAAVEFEVPTRVAGTFPCVASVASPARETTYTNNFSPVTLIVPAASDPTPRVAGVTSGSEGIRLRFPSLGGARYRLEWSADLRPDSWQTAADYVYGTGDAMEIGDPRSRDLPVGFYRLVLLP